MKSVNHLHTPEDEHCSLNERNKEKVSYVINVVKIHIQRFKVSLKTLSIYFPSVRPDVMNLLNDILLDSSSSELNNVFDKDSP